MHQFGDSIIYFASGAGDGRAIQAMVDREVGIVGETGEVNALATVVRVFDNVTTGISSTEIDTQADEILVSLRVGETPQRRAIVRVVSTENGLVRFIVQ